MVDTALRCLARTTWMFIEKRAEDGGNHTFLKAPFMTAQSFGIQQLYVGESHCAELLSALGFVEGEPSQC